MSEKKQSYILRFNGEKPTGINLAHVTNMQIEGKRITFAFYSSAIFIDLENEEAAKTCFEHLMNIWASNGVTDVVE